jgi:predicted phosphodiesterase
MKMKPKRYPVSFCAIGDTHGDMAHWPTIHAAVSFCADFKPTLRIHLGDLADMRPLRTKASAKEANERPAEDLAAAVRILKAFKPNIWLLGNHDQRLWDARDAAHGITADWAAEAVEELTKAAGPHCQILPYDRRHGIYQVGPMAFMHGYSHAAGAVKRAAEAYGLCMMGHIHTADAATIPGIARRTGFSCPCACELDMDYARGNLASLRHCHGFAYGWVYEDDADVYLAREVAGRFHVPAGWHTLEAAA